MNRSQLRNYDDYIPISFQQGQYRNITRNRAKQSTASSRCLNIRPEIDKLYHQIKQEHHKNYRNKYHPINYHSICYTLQNYSSSTDTSFRGDYNDMKMLRNQYIHNFAHNLSRSSSEQILYFNQDLRGKNIRKTQVGTPKQAVRTLKKNLSYIVTKETLPESCSPQDQFLNKESKISLNDRMLDHHRVFQISIDSKQGKQQSQIDKKQVSNILEESNMSADEIYGQKYEKQLLKLRSEQRNYLFDELESKIIKKAFKKKQ